MSESMQPGAKLAIINLQAELSETRRVLKVISDSATSGAIDLALTIAKLHGFDMRDDELTEAFERACELTKGI